MGLRKQLKRLMEPLHRRKRLQRYAAATPGSTEWLIGAELKYGGMVTQVERNVVSPLDPRTKERISLGGMTGGDRMGHHGYAAKYAEYLAPFVASNKPLVIAEFGILKGSGLALWSELFPQARLIGLDIDLAHTKSNLDYLKRLGAFPNGDPELYEYDQFIESSKHLKSILKGDTIDICIDDGFHSIDSIMCTMQSVFPHLSPEFVYFVEDNRDVHHKLKDTYPDLNIDNEGEFTVITNAKCAN